MNHRIQALALVVLLSIPLPVAAHCFEVRPGEPRTLVLALDGMPLRAFERARELGAFADWPDAVPLVSTFPSVTNVAFTAMFHASGVERSMGYEVQWYDVDRNKILGGTLFGYGDQLNAWRGVFDITGRSMKSKFAVYTGPKAKAKKEFEQARLTALEPQQRTVLAHVGGTDAMIHLRGDDEAIKFLVDLDEHLQELRRLHYEELGSELRLVLLSDHGNTRLKVHKLGGLKKRLRRAGLRDLYNLERKDDVVAATFGIVSYGALYTAPENAEVAARAVVGHPHVDIAAWRSGDVVHVVSDDGWARIHQREESTRLRYERVKGDPLRLTASLELLAARDLLDADGFALDGDWLEVSATNYFPDAMRRLIEAMEGAYVKNSATVLFSVEPGYAWGWRSAHASANLSGGRLEGTHGGLDRDSTLGFFVSNDPALVPDSAIRAQNALDSFFVRENCVPRTLVAD